MPRFLIALGFSVLLCGTAAASVDITTCGQSVPEREDGILMADLTCPDPGIGVVMGSRSKLHLNGHTISGGSIGVFTHAKTTEIVGPGTISGASQYGIFAPNNEGSHRFLVHGGIELTGHGIAAIALGESNRARLTLDDVSIHDNPGSANIHCNGLKLAATDVTVRNNGGGLCGDGIALKRSVVENNAGIGIFSWKAHVRLKDSTVTGNDATNGWDIATTHKPRLVGASSCGSSVVVLKFQGLPGPASPSWGVCAND